MAGNGSPGDPCTYAEGICECLVCMADASDTTHAWGCRRWGEGVARGCPAVAPTVGDRCTSPELLCHYGTCSYAGEISLGSSVQCTNDRWEEVINTADCPPPSCESLR
jgi:hypothetical protein